MINSTMGDAAVVQMVLDVLPDIQTA